MEKFRVKIKEKKSTKFLLLLAIIVIIYNTFFQFDPGVVFLFVLLSSISAWGIYMNVLTVKDVGLRFHLLHKCNWNEISKIEVLKDDTLMLHKKNSKVQFPLCLNVGDKSKLLEALDEYAPKNSIIREYFDHIKELD